MGTPFRTIALLALLAVILCTVALQQRLIRAEPIGSEKAAVGGPLAAQNNFVAPAEERTLEVLAKPLPLDFTETPLKEICERISKKAGVKIELDEKGLRDAGFDGDTAVPRVNIKDISLGSALRLMLRPLHLCPVVTPEGTVLVTTLEVASAKTAIKLYHVQDLITTKDDLGEEVREYENLIETVTATVRPQSWDLSGGPGSIKGLQGAVVVNQSHELQQEVGAELDALRKARERQEKNPGGPALFAYGTPAEQEAYQRIRKKLEQPIVLETAEKKLGNVLDYLNEKQGLCCEFDEVAIRDAGIDLDVPLTVNVGSGLPLRVQLQRLLQPLNMTCVIRDEILSFTTVESANATVETRVYPIGDLLAWNAQDGTAGRLSQATHPGQCMVGEHSANQDDDLLGALTGAVGPPSWDVSGGPGTAKIYAKANALVVRQTQAMHEQIENFLAQLRTMHREHPPLVPPPANAVAFEDKLLTKTFEMPSNDATNYLPAADVVALMKKSLGPRVWEADGVFIRVNEWVQASGDGKDQPEQRLVRPALVVRQKPAVIREIRRLLKELNVYVDPASGGSSAFSGMGGMGGGGGPSMVPAGAAAGPPVRPFGGFGGSGAAFAPAPAPRPASVPVGPAVVDPFK